jgi:hypothetical protein
MSLGSFRQRPIRRRWPIGITTVVMIAAIAFFVASSGAVTGSPSNFESADGNMTNDTGTATVKSTDWNCFTNSDNFQSSPPVNAPSNCAVTTGATQVSADANGEITWVNGQKFDTQCPALQTGNVPNKDDYTNIAEYQEFASNGDLYFYGGSIRATANGNASGDVEFNQSSGDGTTTAGCRTAGDRLVAYDFLNGGTSLDFHVLTWIDPTNLTAGGNSGKCFVKTDKPSPTGCWGAFVITPSPGAQFDGQANQAAILAADNGINGAALAAQQFAEFGVNLTQALGGGTLPCFPQQVWETRSSGSSFTSNPEDIEFAHVSTCGALKIVKTAKNKNLGSGDQPQANVSFTVVGPSPSTASQTLTTGSDGTKCVESLAPGSYTVTETVPTGYKADTTSQTAVVASGSTCDGSPTTKNFHNTPLSTITVGFHSLAGTGVTTATVKCTGETSAANLPEGDATKTLGNGTSTLTPGTYSCEVVVDP